MCLWMAFVRVRDTTRLIIVLNIVYIHGRFDAL